ncbi:MAG: MMPL family transporter [Pseudomonadota bacterium]
MAASESQIPAEVPGAPTYPSTMVHVPEPEGRFWRAIEPRLLGVRTAIALIVLIHAVAAFFLLRLEFNNAPVLYFPAQSPAAVLERQIRAEFPNDELLIALFSGAAPYSHENLAALDKLRREMEQRPEVDRVFSVTSVDHIAATEDGFAVEPLVDAENLAERSADEWRERVLADRFVPGWLASKDGTVLALVVRVKKLNESRQRVAIEEYLHETVKTLGLRDRLVAVAGPVALDAAEFRSMIQDSVMFTPLVFVIGLQLLLWVVGRGRPMLIGAVAMSTVVVSCVALIAAIGQPYTLVTAMVPTLLAAYTVANLLHYYAALQRMRNAGFRRPRRVVYATRLVHKPAFFNLLSTIAGTASLVLVPIPPVQVFGLVASFGALMIYIVIFYLVPPLLVAFDKGPWPRGTAGFAWTKRISYGLASFSMRNAGWVVSGVVLLVGLATPQIWKVTVESDLLKFFDDGHAISKSTRLIEERLVGVGSLEIVVDGAGRDAFKDAQTLRRLKDLQTWVETLPEVDRTFSMADLVEEMNWAFHGEDPVYRAVPDDSKLLSQLLLIYDGRDLEELVNGEYQRARIVLNLNVHGANEISAVIAKIKAHLAGHAYPGLRFDFSGFGRQFSDQQELLVVGQMHSFAGAFGQIFLIMLVLWRSLPAAVISMLPNLAPLMVVFILMGTLGIYLDMATVLIASVLLGITVDDTIHFFHQYQERRHKGFGVVFSLARSFDAAGKAVVAISLLLVTQFLLLVGSHFQPTVHFGLLTATGLLAGQVFELLLLPALVVLWGRLRIRRAFMSV